jgi:peptide/nickel transport system ATP-binding protein
MSEPLLELDAITVKFGQLAAVRNVSLRLGQGEILGLVGESGSGKSTLGYAVVGHLGGGSITSGAMRFRDLDLVRLRKSDWGIIRGRHIGMVFQDPQSALNPAYSVGEQIAEGLRHHFRLSPAEARDRTVAWLARVHLPTPDLLYDRYPHQLSGGQLQRAVIAMAFALEPALVIMDEPTTGLDVTTQARILELVADLREKAKVAILFISHDLGVVSDLCDRVTVLHRGRMVEEGGARIVLDRPLHPYSQRLVSAIPSFERRQTLPDGVGLEDRPPIDEGCSFRNRCAGALAACATVMGSGIEAVEDQLVRCWRYQDVAPIHPVSLPVLATGRRTAPVLLEIRDLVKIYPGRRGASHLANDHVSIDIRAGEAVALVGESGSGKSTIAKCILGLEAPTGGQILFRGEPLPGAIGKRPRIMRRHIQIVFQNPDASLNGRHTVAETLRRPLLIHGLADSVAAADARAAELLQSVDLPTSYLTRYPHELSGGEKQRVGIARALACEPDLIVYDEPVSALDVSVQSTIIDLCRRLQERRGMASLFITHDLGVVRQVAERAVVMLRGRVCHAGTVDSLFAADAHPYVLDLLASLPGQRRRDTDRLDGEPSSAGIAI